MGPPGSPGEDGPTGEPGPPVSYRSHRPLSVPMGLPLAREGVQTADPSAKAYD